MDEVEVEVEVVAVEELVGVSVEGAAGYLLLRPIRDERAAPLLAIPGESYIYTKILQTLAMQNVFVIHFSYLVW